MTKRKWIAIIIICAVVFAGTIGGVVAYMIKISQEKKGDFVPAAVSCTINEGFVNNQKSDIIVTNTSNIDVYVRVRMVTYWLDTSGNVINKTATLPAFTLDENWVKDAASDTYYYKLPVATGAQTSNLLETALVLGSEDGYRQVIDIFAEAIQANPAEAAQNSWGVTVSNGEITP